MGIKALAIALATITLTLYGVYHYKNRESKPSILVHSRKPVVKDSLDLKFNSTHEFTILQFTDLHYGADEEANGNTSRVQEFLINLVKPDVVVVTGDAVSGNDWDKTTPGFYKAKWQEFTQPYLNLKVPYAYAYGNHDTDADFNGAQIAELEKTHPFSLFNGTNTIDPQGFSNYVLQIKSSFFPANTTPAALLWMFDTKSQTCINTENSWGCITANQLKWFIETTNQFVQSNGARINGLGFFHIPLPEYMDLWNYGMTYFDKNAKVSCPRVNTGAFEVFKQMGSIKGLFCGHDHTNDFGGNYQGIELVYGRKTGYGAKGPLGYKGARIIKLTEKLSDDGQSSDFSFEHMIIEESGKVIKNPDPVWQGGASFQTKCDFYK